MQLRANIFPRHGPREKKRKFAIPPADMLRTSRVQLHERQEFLSP